MSIAPTEAPIATLTHADRCDRCGARAYVSVLLKWSPDRPSTGELFMCAHDYHRNEEALAPYVSMVVDERWQLTQHIADDHHVH